MYSDIYAAENAVDATMNSEIMMGLFWGIILFTVVLCLISIISNWKIFNKAGKPGWASIIPFYNYVVMIQIAKLSMIYLLLMFVPIAQIYAIFKINIEIAKKFGKSAGFGIGMTLVPIIFVPLLAFSDNTYEDNKVENTKEENLNDNVGIHEQTNNTNNNIFNININNQAPIMTDVQNTIPTEPIEKNISNNEIKYEEQNNVNDPSNTEEINSNVSSVSQISTMEQVNNEQIISTEQNVNQSIENENIGNVTVDSNLQINEVPVAGLENKTIEPIQVEGINNIEIPVITPQEITATKVNEGNIKQGKVCKNCGEAMPNIVSICPKCGIDNE